MIYRTACWTRCATTARTTPPPSANCLHEPSVCCRSYVPSVVWVSSDCGHSSNIRVQPQISRPQPLLLQSHRRRTSPLWLVPAAPAPRGFNHRRSRRTPSVEWCLKWNANGRDELRDKRAPTTLWALLSVRNFLFQLLFRSSHPGRLWGCGIPLLSGTGLRDDLTGLI